MGKRIGLISDTHIPVVDSDLPASVYKHLDECDLILHAGDFVDENFYKKLKSKYKIVGVLGNMDSLSLGRYLKTKEIIEIEGVKVGLTHGRGAPSGLIDLCIKEFNIDKVDVIVFGHSHQALIKKIKGVLFINPGSPTDTVFAPYKSMAILCVEKGEIKNAEIVKV